MRIKDGYNRNVLDGTTANLNRSAINNLNRAANQWPNVVSLTHSAMDEPAAPGSTVTLSLKCQSYAWPANVDIFVDSDSNPYNGNEIQCTPTVHLGATGNGISAPSTAWNTTGYPAGTYQVFARVSSSPPAPNAIKTRYLYARQPIVLSPSGLLPAPILIAPSNGNGGQAPTPAFSWSPVAGATSYRIMVAQNPANLPTSPTAGTCPTCVFNDTTTSTNYSLNSLVLSPGTTYYWQVHARSPNYFGDWSSVSSFTTVSAITWTGAAGDGQWNNPTNWNPKVVPNSYNYVIVNSGTVYVPPNFTFQNLTLQGGTMQNSFSIDGTMIWTGGTVGNTGTLTIPSQSVLKLIGSNTKSLQRTLNNSGTINWSDAGQLMAGGIGATINNQAGAVFTKLSDAGFNTASGHSGITFNNAGLFRKSGGTDITYLSDFTFNHTGTIEVSSGVLDFTGNNTLNLSGNLVAAAGSTISFRAGSGQETTINGVLNGTLEWAGGWLKGAGLVISTGSTLNLSGSATKGLNAYTITNAGTINWSDAGQLMAGGTGATINNQTGAVFAKLSDADFNTASGSAPLTFNNAGMFRKSYGTNTSTISRVVFNNAGSLELQAGLLRFNGAGFVQTAGTTRLNGGSLGSTTPLDIRGGNLAGNGIIFGSVVNNGTIAPGFSAGNLSISNSLTAGTNSTIELQLGGYALGTQYDFLSAGTAALDGTLSISFIDGFQNLVTNFASFTICTASPLSGLFKNVPNGGRLASSDGFAEFIVSYGPNSLVLTVASVNTPVTPIGRRIGNDFVIRFSGALGKTYRVERTDDLADPDWIMVGDVVGNGGEVEATDLGGATQPKRFYRIRLLP